MNAKGVAVFLLLAFGMAWVVWSVPIFLRMPPASAAFQWLVLPGAFAPAIAAVVVRRWVTREGFADAGLGLSWRAAPYFLAGLLVALAIPTFDYVVAPAIGIGASDYHRFNGAPLWLAVLPFIAAAAVTTPGLFGEEFGWRSYLQLRLFPRRPVLAAIATGVIWGVWHYPLLLLGTELPGHPWLILVLFPLGTVFFSIVFGWIRLRSGSIWPAAFAHAANNNLRVPLLAVLFAWPGQDKLPLALLTLAGFAILATAIVAAGGLRARTRP